MMIRLNKIQKGILLAFVGVMIMTPDTLLIRMVSLDIWSLLFYRSLLPALALFLGYLVLFQRRTFNDFYNMGIPGIMNALCVLGANITFIFALANTNVANVLIMISLVPLTAALFSSVFLKEKPLVITWISMFACLLVVIFIFYESYAMGRILGDFLALLGACFVGASLTVIRSYNEINFVPSYILGKSFTALFALPFAATFVITGFDLLFTSLMIITVGFSFVFISLAPQYISSPEVGIFFLLETVLGPLWVWLFISEEPTANTLIGGTLIILIILCHSLYIINKEKRKIIL